MNKLIDYEEEVLSKLLPTTSEVSIGGSAVRNRYFGIPYDVLDIYINVYKISNATEWKDYVIPELFNFGEDNYYASYKKGESFTDYLTDIYTDHHWTDSSLRGLKRKPQKTVIIDDYVSFKFNNKRVKLIFVTGSPQHFLAKYPRFNIRKCFYYMDKYYYSKEFKEAANSKIITINSHFKKAIDFFDHRLYNEAVNIVMDLGHGFRLGQEIIDWKESMMKYKKKMGENYDIYDKKYQISPDQAISNLSNIQYETTIPQSSPGLVDQIWSGEYGGATIINPMPMNPTSESENAEDVITESLSNDN